MPEDDGYALLAVGDGRRIERFGDRVVDRPAPGAPGTGEPGAPGTGKPVTRADGRRPTGAADLRFDRDVGWTGTTEPWTTDWRGLRLELRPTDAGQLGLFPEHAILWPQLHEALEDGTPTVLHLFAYTGATTLALARAGARPTHVDASRPAVAWARRNAELSDLSARPVRWIVDDARTFVARERRRGRRYDAVVLDPPTWGHGPRGDAWRLEDDLDDLLGDLAGLTGPEPRFVLLTAHATAWSADRLGNALGRAWDTRRVEAGDLRIDARDGSALALGAYATLTTSG